jgi:hypothetical protein
MKSWIIVQQLICDPLLLSLSFTLTFNVLRFLFISGIILGSFLFLTIMKWNIDSKLQLSNFIVSYITSKQNFVKKSSNWEIWLIYYETWEKLMTNIMSLSYTLLDTCITFVLLYTLQPSNFIEELYQIKLLRTKLQIEKIWTDLLRNVIEAKDTSFLTLHYSQYIAVIKLYWRVVSNQNFENKTSNYENNENMNRFIIKH